MTGLARMVELNAIDNLERIQGIGFSSVTHMGAIYFFAGEYE